MKLSLAPKFRALYLTEHVAQILDKVSLETGVTTEALLGRSRLKSVAVARAKSWRALREAGMSYPEIAALFDRDHTTICLVLGSRARKAAA